MGLAVATGLFAATPVIGAEPAGTCHGYCSKLPAVQYKTVDDIPTPVIEFFHRSAFIENALSQGLSVIRNIGEGQRRLTREHVDSARQREERDQKRRAVTSVVVYDLNFDGYVTRAEIEEALQVDQRNVDVDRVKRQSDEIMAMDTDGDGRISLREAAEAPSQKKNYGSRRMQGNQLENLLSLDIDGDGALSDKEMEAIIYAGFAVLDVDGDGKLSEQEQQQQPLFVRAQRERERADLESRISKCQAPKPAAEDDIAFLAAHNASAYSSAGFTTYKRLTYAAEVSVSALDKKTYLALASSEPMIWDITGTTSRVSQVLIFGPRDQAGAILSGVRGFDKSRISFLAVEDCLPQMSREIRGDKSGEMEQSSLALEMFLGRAPTVAQGIRTLYEAALLRGGFVLVQSPPPGKLEKPQDGFDAEIWTERIAAAKTDLRLIAAQDVFSSAKIADMSVLPASYGLAKLVHDGVIEKVPTGNFARVFRSGNNSVTVIGASGNDKVIVGEGSDMRRVPIYEYRLRRDVAELPASLMGIDKLLVPDGIKLPEGTGLRECEGQKGPVGERVYAAHCRR